MTAWLVIFFLLTFLGGMFTGMLVARSIIRDELRTVRDFERWREALRR